METCFCCAKEGDLLIGMKREIIKLLALLLSLNMTMVPMAGCGQGESGGAEADQAGEIVGSEAEDEVAGDVQEPEDQEPEDGKVKKPEIDYDDPYMLLVNKTHPLDKDYVPEGLKDIKYYASDRSASSRYMVGDAADHFHLLVEAAAEEGHEIVMTTAYRSYGFQQVLWDNYVAKHGEEKASTFSARPGTSEHQAGLCTDVSSPSVNYQLTTKYGSTPEGQWLSEHAHEYGFIIRYMEGKEHITGYQYEPWHIRYVGKEAAAYIYQEQITFEEYLGILD